MPEIKPGDLVEIDSVNWFTFQLTKQVAIVLSKEDEYMGGNMYTVYCDGEMCTVHESEIRKLCSSEDSSPIS